MLSKDRWARLIGRRNPTFDVEDAPAELLTVGMEARMGPPQVNGKGTGFQGPDTVGGGANCCSFTAIIDPPAGGFAGGDIIAWLPRDFGDKGTIGAVVVKDWLYYFLPGLYRYHLAVEVSGGVSNFAWRLDFEKAGPGPILAPGPLPWGPASYPIFVRKPASVAYRSEMWGKIFMPTTFACTLNPSTAIVDNDVTMVDFSLENDWLLDEAGSAGGVK